MRILANTKTMRRRKLRKAMSKPFSMTTPTLLLSVPSKVKGEHKNKKPVRLTDHHPEPSRRVPQKGPL
jgi:hypothetical protein